MTSRELVSITANEVGDPGFEFLNKDEYMQMMNETIQEIGNRSGAFYQEELYDTETGNYEISITEKDVIKIIRLEYLFGGGKGSPENENILPCREVAFGRVEDEIHNLGGAHYNLLTKTKTYYNPEGDALLAITESSNKDTMYYENNWYSTKIDNGLITIRFGFKFQAGDKIRMWYLSKWNYAGNFNDQDIVWDQMRTVIQEGMRWRALRRLQFRPKTGKNQNWEYQKEYLQSQDMYYRRYLPNFSKYIKHLKTTQDIPKINPFKYP